MDLCTFGFTMSNEAFVYYSWYFRNALVHANYNNLAKGITATTEYIERFFRNLILGEENELSMSLNCVIILLFDSSKSRVHHTQNGTEPAEPPAGIVQ